MITQSFERIDRDLRRVDGLLLASDILTAIGMLAMLAAMALAFILISDVWPPPYIDIPSVAPGST